MPQQLLANPPTKSGNMYGIGGYNDAPDIADYDPWKHAEELGAQIVSNITLPSGIVAAYSHQLHMIFFQAGLPEDVELCAIAHELVHWEYRDKGKSTREEARANRISTLRLVRPSRIEELALKHNDLAGIARELNVTEHTMRLYARMARNGTLP